MDLPVDKKQDLFNALTYRIVTREGMGRYENVEIVRTYKMITPEIISIPQGRTDLIPENYEVVDKRVLEFADFPEPKYPLLPEQKVVYDKIDSTCFINALVGWGKTFTALHVAHKLGQKTLVVTHTKALRDQWILEVENLFGIVPGTIEAGVFNIEDHPIVVANIQSLVRNTGKIEKEFGTIIMDEAHHTPATTFTQIIDSSHARYRIALSGTMERADGRHVLFPDYFGSTVFKPPQNNTLNPEILLVKSEIKIPPGATWQKRITSLLENTSYRDLIGAMALVQANKGHKVLVIADRVEFLLRLAEDIGPRATAIVGDTKDRKTELNKIASGECDILCGSRNIFAEGISQNELSCVILAIPIANKPTLEQIIGRIMRLSPGKNTPVVVDIQFTGKSEKVQNAKRIALYLEKGWKMISV
jgi:superfamily II DNA or RNA helicase